MTFTREVEGLGMTSVIGLRVPLEWMLAFYIVALGVFTIVMGLSFSRRFTQGSTLRIRKYNLWPDAKRIGPWVVVSLALHAFSGGIVYYGFTLLFFSFYSLFKAAFIAIAKPQYLCLDEGILLQNTGLGRNKRKLAEMQEIVKTGDTVTLKFEDNLDTLVLDRKQFNPDALNLWLQGFPPN